jgi:diguanylate cyclase (GGDEF)-like protein
MSPSSTRPPEEEKPLAADAAALRSAERRSFTSSGDGLQSWSGMTTTPPVERLPLLDRMAEKAGSTGRLSDAAKCLFVQALMSVAAGIYSLTAAALDGWPFFDDTVLGPVRASAPWSIAIVALWPLMLVPTLRLVRAQDAEPRPVLTHATAIYYAVNIAFFSYVTGPFSAPSGFALLAGVTTGMLFFERQVLLIGLLFHVVGLAAIAYLSHQGFLPFEALYMASTAGRGLDPDWLLRSTVATVALAIIVFPFLGMIVDSWRYRELRLERAAQTDALTGIYNRGYAMEVLDRAFARASEKRPLSVVMVDIDHFKKVNDDHGHLIGDEVLRQVATALQASLRKNDTLGRFGGEEFLLVLPGIGDGEARVVAERCRVAVAALDFGVPAARSLGGSLRVTASFGIATLPPIYATVETLLDVADAALYEAKRGGRNSVVSDRDSMAGHASQNDATG